MTAWHVHKGWVARAALVLTISCLIDGLVGGFAPKPLPWVGLIAGTLPLSMMFLVAFPLLKKAERDGPPN